MTWKCCRPLLWALSLLVASTASAAKISFSEKGFVDIGALIQAQYRIEQDAAGSGKDPSNDFLLRRARLILSGQFNDNIGFLVATDVSYATGPGTSPKWAGDGAAASGFGVFGLVSLRFGVIGPYVQIEWFNSDAAYVGRGNTTGDLTTYRGGFSWYVLQHVYKITAEIAFQNKEQAGNTVDGTLIPANHWVGTLQFQASF
ncbi:MAG TPA: hypothetical protein VGG91_02305 [Myxococcaceae bacterium]